MKDSELLEHLAKVKDAIFFHRKKFSTTMYKALLNHYRYMYIYLRYQSPEKPIVDIITDEESKLMDMIDNLGVAIEKNKHTESFTEFAVLELQKIERNLIRVKEE